MSLVRRCQKIVPFVFPGERFAMFNMSLRLRVRSIDSFTMFKRRIVSPALIWKSWAAWSESGGAEGVGDAVVLVEVDDMESTAAIIVCVKCV